MHTPSNINNDIIFLTSKEKLKKWSIQFEILPVPMKESYILIWDEPDIMIPSVFGLVWGARIWILETVTPRQFWIVMCLFGLSFEVNPLSWRLSQWWKPRACNNIMYIYTHTYTLLFQYYSSQQYWLIWKLLSRNLFHFIFW